MSAPIDFTIYPASKAIWDAISTSTRVLLHLHPSPDPDSVGSALATGLLLRQLGKQVTVISGDSPFDPAYQVLPGSDLIKFANIFQINLADYDLFIIQDSTSLVRISSLGEIKFPPALKTICIDHHSTNSNFATINLVDAQAPATCQILFQLFSSWSVTITPDIATNLYIGIYTDTLSFTAFATTPTTLHTAASLSQINPSLIDTVVKLENCQPPEKIYFTGLVLSSICTFCSGRVAISSVSLDQMTEHHLTYSGTENTHVVDIMRTCKDWDIVCVLREPAPNTVRVSLRSKDSRQFDVAKIAIALGGAGHPFAAGATINANIASARQQVLDTIQNLYPKLQ